MALADAAKQLSWLRQFSEELGFSRLGRPTPMVADNNGAIFLASNPAHDRRTKHMELRYHYIREFIEAGHGKLYHIPTADMIADQLTKSLDRVKVQRLRELMGMVEID